MDARENLRKIEMAYWNSKPEEAVQPATELSGTLDYDDDDDMELVSEILLKSFDHNDLGLVPIFKNAGMDINYQFPKRETLLLRYAKNGVEIPVLQGLVDLGADAYAEDVAACNILLHTCAHKVNRSSWCKQPEALAVYIAQHFERERLFHTDNTGRTPLHYAVENESSLVVQALLAGGADCNVAGSQPFGGIFTRQKYDAVTPLDLACLYGFEEIAGLLLAHGADDSLTDNDGKSAVFYLGSMPEHMRMSNTAMPDSMLSGKLAILPRLKTLNGVDHAGNTPFHYMLAGMNWSYTSEQLSLALLEAGADGTVPNFRGIRPLHLACYHRYKELLKMLLKDCPDLNVADLDGNTPLHYCCKDWNTDGARKLVKKGANCYAVNNVGKSPLEMATEKGNTELVELMLEYGAN